MKRRMKQLLCLVLALSLMGQFLPVMARADSAGDQLKRLELERFERVVEVNPLYADMITVEEPDRAPERDYSLSAAASASEIADFDEATAILRAGLVAREPEILVTYSIDDYDEDLLNRIFDAARVHTGNPKEGDCLDWGWETIGYDIGAYSFTEGYLVLVFTPTYYTTPEQERELDAAVDALLATVDRSARAYDQIKTVYDYICANITYDYDNLNDKSYTLKFTPYAALVNGTAVCQGYALLLYRLALELGIDARLIAGSSEGDGNQDHGWNILCIDGKYYNADSTWDAGRSVYNWFLQSEEHFTRGYTGHIRSTKYDTAEFHAAYPMSGTDYDPDALPVDPNLVTEGTCGDGVFWRLTKDGTLTISGEGDMTDYTYLFDGQPWREYVDSITAIRVEGTVNSIGSFAFAGMDNQSLMIEDGVESIGEYAFCGCPELTEVTIPDSVTTVDSFAFHDCVSLTRVQIGKGTTGIGDFVFGSCGSMREINVHEENPCYSSDSRGVLFDRNRTVLIYAPGALEGSYSVPEGVTSIRNSAFSDCDRMTELDLPDSVTTVGEWAFSGCASMTRMDMGNGVLTIGNSAFRDCISLTGLVIPDSVTTVGEETFSGCNSLARLVIGSGVTRMDNWAVEACPSLREIVFRGSAPSFGKNVFANVTAVVHYPGNDPTWTDAVKQNHGGSLTWVPYAQEVASGWSGYTQWTLTDDGVLRIYGTGNMKNYHYNGGQPWLDKGVDITSVVVETGVTAIGSGAFRNLTTLESVTLPEKGLTKIGEAAFYGCTGLKQIHIPDGIYTVWAYTFKNCTALESVRLPKTLLKIDQGAFENCTALPYVFIPGDTHTIGSWSFKGCTGLEEADMQWTDATEIREGAFKNCSALNTILLPSGIEIFGDSCFYGIGATSFEVPATVTQIRAWCFARAYSLTEITFEGDAPAIGEGAFNRITLTARYPSGNSTWDGAVKQSYGGEVIWEAA